MGSVELVTGNQIQIIDVNRKTIWLRNLLNATNRT
jgi:hypothetical protein